MLEFLLVFGLYEMVISEASTVVLDMPPALVISVNIRLLCFGERVFIKGVSDEFTSPVGGPLGLKNVLYI